MFHLKSRGHKSPLYLCMLPYLYTIQLKSHHSHKYSRMRACRHSVHLPYVAAENMINTSLHATHTRQDAYNWKRGHVLSPRSMCLKHAWGLGEGWVISTQSDEIYITWPFMVHYVPWLRTYCSALALSTLFRKSLKRCLYREGSKATDPRYGQRVHLLQFFIV